MKNLVRIERDIPLSIFDEPVLQEKVAHLFNGAEGKIKARFNEIVTFLKVDYATELSYENILSLFKTYFYKSVLSEAVEITFSGDGNYDALSNIISLLSEEKLENAIIGKPMIDAFAKAIHGIPATSALSACLYGSKILLMEKEFLGKVIFPTSEANKKGEQSNYCGDYGCSCACDSGSGGSTKSCT